MKLTAGGDTERDRGGSHVKVDLVLATLGIRQTGGNSGRSQQDQDSQHQSQSQGSRMQNLEAQQSTAHVSPRSMARTDVSDPIDEAARSGQSADLGTEVSVRDVSAVLAGFTDGDSRLRNSSADHQINIDNDEDEEIDRVGSERFAAQPSLTSNSGTSVPRSASTPMSGPISRLVRRKPKRMLDSSSEEEGE